MEVFKSSKSGPFYYVWRDMLRSIIYMLVFVALCLVFRINIKTEEMIIMCLVIFIMGFLDHASVRRIQEVSLDRDNGVIEFKVGNLYKKFAESFFLNDVSVHLYKGKSKMPFSVQRCILYIENKENRQTLVEISNHKDGFSNETIQNIFNEAKESSVETFEKTRNPLI